MSVDYYFKLAKKLLAQKLYSSAETISNFGISRHGDSAELLYVLGRALYGQKEYLHAYKKMKKALSKHTSKQLRNLNLTPSTPVKNPSLDLDIEIKNSFIKICLKLKYYEEAKETISKIPANIRSVEQWLALAKALTAMGRKKDAIYAYGIVLKENPAAVEAAFSILELGGALPTLKSALISKSVTELDWYSPLCIGYANQLAGKNPTALTNYEQIEKIGYATSPTLLELEGRTFIQCQDSDNAKSKLKKIREQDPNNTRFIDVYCSVLTASNDQFELERVMTDLLSIPSKTVSVWTALAVYSEWRGNKSNALNFIESAIQINPQHRFARLFRGTLFLSIGKTFDALQEFLVAYNMRKELNAFTGIVRTLIAQQKIKEALTYAKEARKTLPDSAGALALVGLVLAQPQIQDQAVRKKARECFDSALKMDPNSTETILAICNLNAWEGKVDEAIQVLLDFSKKNPRDFIYARLGDLYQVQSKIPQAFQYYFKALTLNKFCESAIEGLNRLTKLLKPKKQPQDEIDEFEEEEEEYELVEEGEEDEEGEE